MTPRVQLLARCALVAASLVLPHAQNARAEAISVDGVRVDLALPEGHCKLSRDHATEKQHLELQDRIQTSNSVHMFTVPCGDVESVRKGGALKRWVIWLMNGPKDNPIRVPPTMTRAQVLSELATAYPKIDLKPIKEETKDLAGKEGIGLDLKTMGVIDQDSNAIYAGQTGEVTGPAGKRELAVVLGQTLLSGRVFSVNTYADFEGRETFTQLLAVAKKVMADTVTKTDVIPVDKSLPEGMKPVP